MGRCFDAAARVSLRSAAFRDMVLKREAGPAYVRCRERMMELFQEEIPVTAEKLTVFFDGSPLDAWFDRDFNGKK